VLGLMSIKLRHRCLKRHPHSRRAGEEEHGERLVLKVRVRTATVVQPLHLLGELHRQVVLFARPIELADQAAPL